MVLMPPGLLCLEPCSPIILTPEEKVEHVSVNKRPVTGVTKLKSGAEPPRAPASQVVLHPLGWQVVSA